MNTGIEQLAAVIAAHLREWEPSPPFVELAIFECADAYSIAGTLNAFCILTPRLREACFTNRASAVSLALFWMTDVRL